VYENTVAACEIDKQRINNGRWYVVVQFNAIRCSSIAQLLYPQACTLWHGDGSMPVPSPSHRRPLCCRHEWTPGLVRTSSWSALYHMSIEHLQQLVYDLHLFSSWTLFGS